MASRPVWKGQLRLSLVSIPIEIHSARESSAAIRFRQIHQPSGRPVKYEKVVPGVGPVDSSEIVKGYETEDDEYILIPPEEIDEIKLETKKTLELVQFVGACEIAPLWFDRPYYVVPSDELAEDAYRVVRDALRQSEKLGLGQLTMRGKEYLCAIRPCGDGLLLETLHYASDLRAAEPMFAQIKDETADEELLAVATQLIDRKTKPFDAKAFRDSYAAALRELIDAKLKNRKTPRTRAHAEGEGRAEGENVVDLMDALKKSLQQSGKTGGGKAGKAGSPGSASGSGGARKSAGRRKSG